MRAMVVLLTLAVIGPARAETQFSLYIGKSFTNDSDLQLRQPGDTRLTFHGVSWEDESFQMPIYYGWRVTHFLEPDERWGIALDFFHYKVFSDPNQVLPVSGSRNGTPVSGRERLGDTLPSFSMSHGVNYLTLNGIHRWRLHSDAGRKWEDIRWQPYLGAGIGAVIPHVEATVGGRTIGEYQWHGPGFQIFTGASYRLASHWCLFAEYKFAHTSITVDVPGGDAHTTLDTHHLVLGGSYRL
jgi:hypothetical protein